MDKTLIDSIKENFRDKTDEELFEIYSKNDTSQFSREAIEASRLLLQERKQTIPNKEISNEKIIAIIPDVINKNDLIEYNLVLTSDRVIFGKISSHRKFASRIRILSIVLIFLLLIRYFTKFSHSRYEFDIVNSLAFIILFIGLTISLVVFLIGKSTKRTKIYEGKSPNEIIDFDEKNYALILDNIDSFSLEDNLVKIKVKFGDKYEVKKMKINSININELKDYLQKTCPDKIK